MGIPRPHLSLLPSKLQSYFKVYNLQTQTLAITKKLQQLAPNIPLNEWFMQIVREGTGKTFSPEDNQNWLAATRPILEAFFHARYFLGIAVQYGKDLEFPPRMLPSGWAAFLHLYNDSGSTSCGIIE